MKHDLDQASAEAGTSQDRSLRLAQRFTSDVLWHFTGGGGKSEDDAFNILLSILKSGLKTGPREEWLSLAYDEGHEVRHGCRACCLADIPLKDLSIHIERYQDVAIGFHKRSVIQNGFNPVLYINERAPFFRSFLAVGDDVQSYLASRDPLLSQRFFEGVRLLLTYCKNVSSSAENDEVFGLGRKYYEREWASLEDWDFTAQDVAVILVPENKIEQLVEERKKGGLRLTEKTPVFPTDMIYGL